MSWSDPGDGPVGIYGFGRDGRSIHAYMRDQYPDTELVVLVDGSPPADLAGLEASDPATRVASGEAARRTVMGGELCAVVRSPGVSIRTGPLREVPSGLPVVTSISLALARHRPPRVVGVTGSKGKSTTSTLLEVVLRGAGDDVALAGNIGTPVLDLAPRVPDLEVLVLELSSYVLADLDERIDVGVLLNLHPEHVDWHGSIERYYADKCRILELADTVVGNGDDPRVEARLDPDAVRFRRRGDTWELGGTTLPHDRLETALAPTGARGRHVTVDLAAALTAAAALGHAPADLLPGVGAFEPLPHRLQPVLDDGRILWVDDSISTIPESAAAAVDAYDGQSIALIAGGFDREQDHGVLVERIRRSTVRAVVTMPDTGARLAAALRRDAPGVRVTEVDDLPSAVEAARAALPGGGVVLLSPAAPSYGMFADFAERGERFATLAAEGT